MQNTGPAISIRSIEDLAQRLRNAFARVIDSGGATSPSPALLSRRLGLEASLARRLLASIREPNPYVAVHRMPGVHGLRSVLDAAARRGVPPSVIKSAEHVVHDFGQLIAEAGGSQERLHSVLSDQVPEIRRTTELRSRSAVFKGMVDLLGHSTDLLVCVKACQPSAQDARRVDVLHVHAHFGLRKLRRMAPLVFGMRSPELEPDVSVHALDGRLAERTNPQALLLRPFCAGVAPALRWTTNALVMETEAFQRGQPVDLALSYIRRRGAARFAGRTHRCELIGYVVSHPAKLLVQDCLVREDLWVGITPRLEMHRTGYRGGVEPYNYHERRFDLLEHPETLQAIGRGLFDLDIREFRRHRELVETSLRNAGWDPARFGGFRTRIVYPVLERQVTTVFELPEEP